MFTSNVPLTSAKGVCRQRHIDALYSEPKHFSADQLRKTTIKTGITVEYTIHSNLDTTEPANLNLPEEHLVLIMGYTLTKESWAPTIDFLVEKWKAHERKKNLRILSFDNRGVGNTDSPPYEESKESKSGYSIKQMAEDTLALLDYLRWEATHVVGISMGGMIALELASMAPHRLQSLTLMVTTRGRHDRSSRAIELMREIATSQDLSVVAQSTLEIMYSEPFLQSQMADTGEGLFNVMLKYHESLVRKRKDVNMVGIFGQLQAINAHYVSDERLREIARKSHYPILIVGSMMDILIPPKESLILKRYMDTSNVRSLLFEHGGHGVSFQYVEEVVDAVIQTIAQVTLTSTSHL